jgi:hypothetical protein
VTVKIDKTAPSISGSRNPLPNLNGWNNSDVTVSFTCGDALSGLAAGSPPAATIVGQGAGQSVSGTCYDQAGNSASDTVANINVDKTAPSVAVTGVTDGATYTLGSVPAAGCSTTDGLSGVNTSATLNLTGGVPPGVGSFTAACNGATDNAGNTANASVTYSVYFGFAGLFQPWESWTDRGFKVKSSIPLKWQYLDSNGVPVDSSLAQPAISIKYLGSCGIGGLDDVVAVQDPGASGLTYDPLTKMWHFNWKTTGLAAGCYNVFIKSNASGQTTGPFTTQLVR